MIRVVIMKKIKLQQTKVARKYVLLDDALTEFYGHCTIKNLADKSIKYYKEVFWYFLKFKNVRYLHEY